jgi:hypothetical protein
VIDCKATIFGSPSFAFDQNPSFQLPDTLLEGFAKLHRETKRQKKKKTQAWVILEYLRSSFSCYEG